MNDYIFNSSKKNEPLALNPLLHDEKQRAYKIAAQYTNSTRTTRLQKY